MDALLAGRSLLTRLLRPVLRAVSRSWQMFPLGLLFGLGFDTATEIGLLGLSATQAAQGLPPWQIMVFPALFTAGMVLVDTADSALMVAAYGWALDQPVRKLWYNLTITTISVVVALLVGGVEAIGLLADRFQLRGRVWAAVAHWADFGANAGFAIVAAVLAIWLLSAALYRWRRGTRSAVAPLPGK
jgi:high-affinity nickel-transport protein